jgi:hypothetical protein
MADKTYVIVTCDVKEIFDSALKAGVTKAMKEYIVDAIDTQSGGKLTTKTESDDAITFKATLSLTADDKDKPTKVEALISFSGMKGHPTTKTYKSSKPAGAVAEGIGRDVQKAVNGLVKDILEVAMKTVIKALVAL